VWLTSIIKNGCRYFGIINEIKFNASKTYQILFNAKVSSITRTSKMIQSDPVLNNQKIKKIK